MAHALADAGLLQDEDPKGLLDYVSWDLLDALRNNAELLVHDFGLANLSGRPGTWIDRIDAPFDVGNLGWVHVTKFPAQIVQYLQQVGLARLGRHGAYPSADPGGSENWVGMHPALAGAYMTALAQRVSEQARFEPLADQDDLRVATPTTGVQGALHLLVGSELAPTSPDEGMDLYVMLALQYARPKDLANTPVDKIIECRTDLAEELATFQAYVDIQRAELAEIAATPIPKRRLEDFAKHVESTIQVPLSRLERGLTLHKLEPTRSLIMAGSFTAPAAVGPALVGHPAAAMAVGTVAAVGSAWWQIEDQRAAAREASPVGYLLDVRDRLTPKTLAARVRKVLRGSYSAAKP
jgi:hypothetical protein